MPQDNTLDSLTSSAHHDCLALIPQQDQLEGLSGKDSYAQLQLSLDAHVLNWYGVSNEQAEYLINFLQFQYSFGNDHIRGALLSLAFSMECKMNEQLIFNNKMKDLEDEIDQLKLTIQEHAKENEILVQVNETLAADARELPNAKVRGLFCKITAYPILCS